MTRSSLFHKKILLPVLAVLLLLAAGNAGCARMPNLLPLTQSASGSADEAAPAPASGTTFETDSGSASEPIFGSVSAPSSGSGLPLSVPVFHSAASATFDLSQIPPWSDKPWVEVNGNKPFFTEEELTSQSFEEYGELDSLGRCTGAFACAGPDLMPKGERESISEIRPTGWHIVKYAGIDGNFLYNRCHLIAYGLTGENANEHNLITGTRYMNVAGMNDFENETIAYIRRTGNHVLYRVTPVFQGNDLVASGVLMEGLSVENSGLRPAICFCIYAYNVQPGVTINYANGESTGALFTGTETADHSPARQSGSGADSLSNPGNGSGSGSSFKEPASDVTYIININSGKFHRPECASVRDMNQHNRRDVTDTRGELLERGFTPCGKCKP